MRSLVAVLFCAGMIFVPGSVYSQGAYTTAQDDPAAIGSEEWNEDMSEKIDKTIKILTVIKKELKNLETEEPAQPTAAGEETNWADNLKGKVSAFIRIWREVRKEMQEEGLQPAGAKGAAIDDSAWIKNVNTKLDQTMEAVQAIKDELKEIEEEDIKQGGTK